MQKGKQSKSFKDDIEPNEEQFNMKNQMPDFLKAKPVQRQEQEEVKHDDVIHRDPIIKKIPTSELEKIFQTKDKAIAILRNHGFMLPKTREINYTFV